MKKGFTIIELLAVIVVLGLLIILTYHSISSSSTVAKEKLLNNKINTTKQMLIIWSKDHLECFKNGSSDNCIIGLNNNCVDAENTNYLKCTTNYGTLASKNIIKYDEDNKIINPLTNNIMNEDNIVIYYNKENGKLYGEI